MPLRPTVQAPSDNTAAGKFARRLAKALGTAYQAADGTAVAQDLLVLGQALEDARATNQSALDQAFANSATDLLPELEQEYGLTVDPTLTDADRQIRLTAKIRALVSSTPQDMLLSVQTYDPTAVMYETLATEAALDGDPKLVYEFAIVISLSVFNDPRKNAEIKANIEIMKQAHTRCNLASGRGFFCDGFQGSRMDDTLFGP